MFSFGSSKIMRFTKGFFIAAAVMCGQFACNLSEAQTNQNKTAPTPTPPLIIADKFAYSIGKTETTRRGRSASCAAERMLVTPAGLV